MNTKLMGLLKKTVKSPFESWSDRRKFFLHHRPQHKTEQQGTGLQSSNLQAMPTTPEIRSQVNIKRCVFRAVNTDGGKCHNGWEQKAVGHLDQTDP
jgi:hypothetical protein